MGDVVRLGMLGSGIIADFVGFDAAYRSMRAGRWAPVDVDQEVARA